MTAQQLASNIHLLESSQGFTIGKGKILYQHIEVCRELIYYTKYKCYTEDRRQVRYIEPEQEVNVKP